MARSGGQPSASDDGPNTIIDLPNFIDPLPLKLMRIQMWFGGSVPGDSLSVGVSASDPLPTDYQIVGSSGPGESIFHWIDVEIYPNPDSEQVIIYGANDPGQLMMFEVDTVSLPEPATLGLLIIGGLALSRPKRST